MEEMKAHPWIKLTGTKIEESPKINSSMPISGTTSKSQQMESPQKNESPSKGIFSPIVEKTNLFPPGSENILGTKKEAISTTSSAQSTQSVQSTSSNHSENVSHLHKGTEDKPDFMKVKQIVTQNSDEWTEEELLSYSNRKDSVFSEYSPLHFIRSCINQDRLTNNLKQMIISPMPQLKPNNCSNGSEIFKLI
jgi:hypothetical protein